MRRLAIRLIVLFFVVAGRTTPVAAQGGLMVGGGAAVPLGDYKAFAKTGWAVNAGYEFSFSSHSPVGVRVDALYGSNKTKTDLGFADSKTNLLGGNVDIVYHVGSGKNGAYVLGGVGVLHHSLVYADQDTYHNEGASKFAVNGGVGITFGPFFIEGRYLTTTEHDANTLAPLIAGFRFQRNFNP